MILIVYTKASRWAAVCEQFYLHKFRRTFACVHLLAGVDVRTLQLWLGPFGPGDGQLLSTGHQRKAEGGGREKEDATLAEIAMKSIPGRNGDDPVE
jgi:hypothetical protein